MIILKSTPLKVVPWTKIALPEGIKGSGETRRLNFDLQAVKISMMVKRIMETSILL